MENKPPPNQKCPRCESTNTKFGYFNNYKTEQPRYFCRICRRYWTQGGKLRNIPFGGGKRFMKRARDSYSSSSCTWELPQVVGNFNKLQTMNMPFARPVASLSCGGTDGNVTTNKLQTMNMPFTRPLVSLSCGGTDGNVTTNTLQTMNMPFTRPLASLTCGGTDGNVTTMSSFNHPPQASLRQSPFLNFENNGLANLAILQGFNNVSSPFNLDQKQQRFPPMQPNGQSYGTENYEVGLLAQTQPNKLINSLSEANIINYDNTNSIVGTNSNTLWDYAIPINETEDLSSSFDHFLGCGPPACFLH